MQMDTKVMVAHGIVNKRVVVLVMTLLVVLATAGAAFALNGGSGNTGVGGDLYDLVVNKFINGPLGAAAGTGFIVVGAVMACMGKISGAVWPLIGGGLLASASTLASSLGLLF